MKISIYLLLLSIFISCKQPDVQNQIQTLQSESLEDKKSAYDSNDQNEEHLFHHLVFLNIKANIDTSILVQELQKLAEIDDVKNFNVNLYKDMKDERALSDYGIMMKMSFIDQDAYERYQVDSLHQNMIMSTKQYMAGPPVSYDYTIFPE